MICELCTMDVVKGTVYRIRAHRAHDTCVICADCRSLALSAEPEIVDEPMCACGKMQKWLCDAAIVAPCKPGRTGA